MMMPIIEQLKKDYEGKLNVVFVNVDKEQVLAARYGTPSIPVQIFFDKNETQMYPGTSASCLVSRLTPSLPRWGASCNGATVRSILQSSGEGFVPVALGASFVWGMSA